MKVQAAKKGSSIILLALLVASTLLLFPQLTSGQTKPTIPDFTVTSVDRSYDMAPIYTVDPYNGETKMISPSYHVTNINLDITIKNQAFTSQKTTDGNYTQLCYLVRAKGHFEQWPAYTYSGLLDVNSSTLIPASSSSYTVLSFPLNRWNIQTTGQLDFQVKAVIANFYYTGGQDYWIPRHITSEIINEGDWSNTQTINIGNNSSTTTQSPIVAPTQQPINTPSNGTTSNQPEVKQNVAFDWQTFVIIALTTAVAILVVIVFVMKRANYVKKVKGSS
ncbi:MAG TPA: hypothetical protein VLH35_08135 [Candidatus Acidoferrales bacterium]|nr:hypothetical protein [Candidatus Acidoferrales bacterium]